jgi:hypothetical protein
MRGRKGFVDIATRLRAICHNLTDEDFSALVEKMT